MNPLLKNMYTHCLRPLPQKLDFTGSCPYLLSAVKTQALLGGRSFLGGSPTFNGKRAQKTGSGTCTICVESCNKVTPKCNRVTLKEQSELTNDWTPFWRFVDTSFNSVFRIWIFPPSCLAKERRAISAKRRKLYAEAQLELSRTKISRTEYGQRCLLSLPPLCWGGWDNFDKSVSVNNIFMISWKYTNQFYSKPQRNRSTYSNSVPRRIVS